MVTKKCPLLITLKKHTHRKISRRDFLKAAVAVGAAGLLAECRANQQPMPTLTNTLTPTSKSASTPEPLTITFAHHSTEHYETLVQEFEKKYPYITVNRITGTAHNGLASLKPGEADIRWVWPELISDLQKRGDIQALDTFIDRDESINPPDFYPAAMGPLTIEGKTWAIPIGSSPTLIYFDKDLFDRTGVPYPKIGWTWDDFLDIAQKMRDPDANIYGYVSKTGSWDALIFIYQQWWSDSRRYGRSLPCNI